MCRVHAHRESAHLVGQRADPNVDATYVRLDVRQPGLHGLKHFVEQLICDFSHHGLPSGGGAFLARGLRGALPPSILPAGDSAPVASSRMALFGSPFALAESLAALRA